MVDNTVTSLPIAIAYLTPISPNPPNPAIAIFKPPFFAPQWTNGSYKVIPAQSNTPAYSNGYDSGILIQNLSWTICLFAYPPYVYGISFTLPALPWTGLP